MTTHEVRNQPPPFGGYDLLAGDPALVAALDRWSPSRGDVTELARLAATSDPARWADQADTYPPVLRTHDAVGNRLDEVDYHPAYHALMTVAVGHGLGAEPWLANAGTGAHVRRATGFYLWSQVENAHLCPVSMTYAAGRPCGIRRLSRGNGSPGSPPGCTTRGWSPSRTRPGRSSGWG